MKIKNLLAIVNEAVKSGAKGLVLGSLGVSPETKAFRRLKSWYQRFPHPYGAEGVEVVSVEEFTSGPCSRAEVRVNPETGERWKMYFYGSERVEVVKLSPVTVGLI